MTKLKTENQLNERDTLTDLLLTEKSLIKTYATALTESSSPAVRSAIKDCLDGLLCHQYRVFSVMNENGYYPVKNAEKSQISLKKENFSKIEKSLAK